MNRWIIAAALLACWSSAAAAKTACLASHGTDAYYQYRMIDGKKCWYRGHEKLEKSTLYWRNTPGASGTARKAPSAKAVVARAMMTEATRDDSPRPITAAKPVGALNPDRPAPDFDAAFAHFPAYAVARPPIHLLYPKNVAQSYGSKPVRVVLYRRPE